MNQTTTSPEPQVEQRPETQPQTAPTGCLLRVYWMLLGNAVVALCAYAITQAEGMLTAADAAYWLAAGAVIGARYVDVHYLGGTTAEGEPPTPKDWRRYALGVLGVAAVLWLAIHALGFATA